MDRTATGRTSVEDLEGRDLDAACACEVVGFRAEYLEEYAGDDERSDGWVMFLPIPEVPENQRGYWHRIDLPHFHSEMESAWKLVDEVRTTVFPGWPGGFQLTDGRIGQEHESLSAPSGGWATTFDNGYGNETFAVGDTPAEAISRSSLKAVRHV